MLRRLALALAAASAVVTLAACGSGGSSTAADPAANPSGGSSPTTSAAAGQCSYPASGQAAKPVDPPPSTPTVTGTVPATIATSIGDIKISLNATKAPCTVNSFVSLAKQGYFDSTSCHRLTTSGIYVLQCGDPSGTGAGGPGYSFADELTGSDHYGQGVLAMANAGPNTNGSQFFFVYADSRAGLDPQPNYTIFGTIDPASVKLLATEAKGGTTNGSGDGAPKIPVNITSVTIG